MAEVQLSMKSVAQRTGLSPHVIRVWEKRYGAVEPGRSLTNRRCYSEAEVRRLSLLRGATLAGHSIGLIARLPEEQLAALAGHGSPSGPAPSRLNGNGRPTAPDALMEAALQGIRRMDARHFESVLLRASLELGSQGLLQKLIAPLAQKLGDLWQAGEMTVAEEHFASGVVRSFLAGLNRPFALPEEAPTLLVATPCGQLHELGAILVATAAVSHGWRVAYVGACLPAVEIAGAAVRTGARAVALSLVYPADDPHLARELAALRACLPTDVAILVGGRAAAAYQNALEDIHAITASNLSDLYAILDGLRVSRPGLQPAA